MCTTRALLVRSEIYRRVEAYLVRFRFARGCLALAPSDEENDVSSSRLCWERSDVSCWSLSSIWLGGGDIDAGGGEAVGDMMEGWVSRRSGVGVGVDAAVQSKNMPR